MVAALDYGDIQGLVRFGYKHMTEACYLLLSVKNADLARSWLRSAPITTAVEAAPPPSTATQVAITAEGLRSLRIPDPVVAGLSAEFLSGMAGVPSRSRRLGDVGSNAPSQWRWGGPGRVPDLMVMLFAEPGGLDTLKQNVMSGASGEAFEVVSSLDTSDLHGVEPFGFTDGISQPEPDWDRVRNAAEDQLDYSNVVALGEFLLGHPNEYGKYTDRPLVEENAASAALLPAEDDPSKKDVGRNGTYLVWRDLRQDVRAFWRFVEQSAPNVALQPDELAASFVGRRMNGDPLVPAAIQSAIPGIGSPQNGFTFDADPQGTRCPIGAHIRRANPRDADFPGRPEGRLTRIVALLGFRRNRFRDDLLSSVRFHRIIRRGREYGPGLSPSAALEPAPADDPERGLHFICLNANIARQFEFLQNAWLMGEKFDGLTDESDPLLGRPAGVAAGFANDRFTLPRDGALRRRIAGLPQFVTVQGGAYFFLPSLRALRYFADVGA